MATTVAGPVLATAEPVETRASAANGLTTQEKLLLSQAVYKVGAAAWSTISQLLTTHPICQARPATFWSPESCEEYYISLMTAIGQNVPAPDAMKPKNKVHLRLAQTYYLARLDELKSEIETYENQFTILMSEINAIKSGDMDEQIKGEIRESLVKKHGQRVLQWIPDDGEIKAAVDAGPIKEGEVDAARDTKDLEKDAGEAVDGPVKPPSAKAQSPKLEQKQQKKSAKPKDTKEAVEAEPKEEGQPEVPPTTEQTESAPTTAEEAIEGAPAEKAASPDVVKEVVKGKKITKKGTKDDSNAMDIDQEEPSVAGPSTPKPSPPASDLSPPPPSQPERQATPLVEATPEPEPDAVEHATRSSKRKASAQPREAPASKRGGRGRRATTPHVVSEAEDPATEEKEDEGKEDEADAEQEAEAEAEPEEELGRGRRASKRHRAHDSPPPTAKTRGSSPATSRRAPSASSNASTPAAIDEKKPKRGKGRGMRDEVVSRSVRDKSATVESVKEEEEEGATSPVESVRPTRTSRRGKKEVSPPVEEKKEMGRKTRSTKTPTLHAHEGDESAQENDPDTIPSKAGGSISASTPLSATPTAGAQPEGKRGPRRSEGKDGKATQKILYNLLDTIQGHQHGTVFATGVKKTDAPDYHEIIKKPMDLKKVRQRIRDGIITGLDDFERDILLIFANATMYNQEGSQVYNMAIEMLREAEKQIVHFRAIHGSKLRG